MIVIESNNLSKSYGKINALSDLSLAIEENKITGLIGRNGAGKTTLLKIIAGYLRPTRGEIKIFGQNPFNSLAVSANLIFVDDNMAFPAAFTLADILNEAVVFYQNFDNELAKGLVEYFTLNLKQRHNRLSKGMKSTFNTIIGIASRCPITIFDEPTTGMDSAIRKDFYRALLKDYLAYPRTIVLSSHLLSEIEELLEDIFLINDGLQCLHQPVIKLKDYAVGIRGNIQAVLRFIENKETIHQERFASSGLCAIVKKDFSPEQLEQAMQNGLEVLPVSLEDLCNCLTTKTKGGIDDVFSRS